LLVPTPDPTPEASAVKLNLYRLAVSVEVALGRYEVSNWWVEAPTQCSAAKHSALRGEIDDISMIELWSKPLPEGATIKFSTTLECP
jgi:hypothetical protein